MTGQVAVLEMLHGWKQNNQIPRFMIITGEKGSGKKTLATHISDNLIGGYTVYPECSVDGVRDAIVSAYSCSSPCTYIFPESDKMSAQAKNALLKITEEPPRQAYFILTSEDISNALPTLKSRGTEIRMAPYTERELETFYADGELFRYASNPGEIKQLMALRLDEFITFCRSVIENIGKVSGVNAFKIANRFKFKEDAEGYDPALFFEVMCKLCMQKAGCIHVIEQQYLHTAILCKRYKSKLSITGIKKDSLFDMWILDMRKIWKEEEE